MNRGSSSIERAGVRVFQCFNEAPIHESGKSRARRGDPRSASRFNEAPIHESGK